MHQSVVDGGLAVACLFSVLRVCARGDPGTEDPAGRNTIGLPTPGDIVRSIRSTRTMSVSFRLPDRSTVAISPWACGNADRHRWRDLLDLIRRQYWLRSTEKPASKSGVYRAEARSDPRRCCSRPIAAALPVATAWSSSAPWMGAALRSTRRPARKNGRCAYRLRQLPRLQLHLAPVVAGDILTFGSTAGRIGGAGQDLRRRSRHRRRSGNSTPSSRTGELKPGESGKYGGGARGCPAPMPRPTRCPWHRQSRQGLHASRGGRATTSIPRFRLSRSIPSRQAEMVPAGDRQRRGTMTRLTR